MGARVCRYTDTITYGEMFLQNEFEMSTFNMDLANIESQRKRFELYDEQAKDLIKERLPLPAYDHLLKVVRLQRSIISPCFFVLELKISKERKREKKPGGLCVCVCVCDLPPLLFTI